MNDTRHQWTGVESNDPSENLKRRIELAKQAYCQAQIAAQQPIRQSDIDLIVENVTRSAVRDGMQALRAAEQALQTAQQAEQQAQAEQRDEDAHAVALDQMKNMLRRMF